MSKRSERIAALVSALEGITVANGYATEVEEVKRGLYDFDDFNLLPAISLWQRDIGVDEYSNMQGLARLRFTLWGHVKCPDGDVSPLDGLIRDLVKCLLSDWPRALDTKFVEDAHAWEDDPGCVSMTFEVEYEFDYTAP